MDYYWPLIFWKSGLKFLSTKEALVRKSQEPPKYLAPWWLVRYMDSFSGLMPCPQKVLEEVKSDIRSSIERLLPYDLVYAIRGFSNAGDAELVELCKKELFRSKNISHLRGWHFVVLADFVEGYEAEFIHALLENSKAKLTELTTGERALLAKKAAAWPEFSYKLVQGIKAHVMQNFDEVALDDLIALASIFKKLFRRDTNDFYQAFHHKVSTVQSTELLALNITEFAELVQHCSDVIQNFAVLDAAICTCVSRKTQLDQGEFEAVLVVCCSLVQRGQQQLKIYEIFFDHLNDAIKKNDCHLSDDYLLDAWLKTGNAEIEAYLEQKAKAEKPRIEFTEFVQEKLILLYLKLSDARPELFSDDVMGMLKTWGYIRKTHAKEEFLRESNFQGHIAVEQQAQATDGVQD